MKGGGQLRALITHSQGRALLCQPCCQHVLFVSRLCLSSAVAEMHSVYLKRALPWRCAPGGDFHTRGIARCRSGAAAAMLRLLQCKD